MTYELRKAAEDLMPILEQWKMTYPPCSGADWDKVEALRQALDKPEIDPQVLVDMAVLAEREACAKVCDYLAAKDKLSNYYAVAAKAIRARGEK